MAQLPNLQHKIHLDNKLDNVFETLQVEQPDLEGIKQRLENSSAWVRYCQGNPRHVFKEFQQVCAIITGRKVESADSKFNYLL